MKFEEKLNRIRYNEKRVLAGLFLVILFSLTAVNAVEFLLGNEEDGRRLGLERLGTVEDTAINAWGAVQCILSKRVAYGNTVYEDVTLLDNGYATMADQAESIEAAKEGSARAYALAREIGADFLYVQAPEKEYRKEDLPEGVYSFAPDKYEAMIAYLKESGIPYLDTREILLREAMARAGTEADAALSEGGSADEEIPDELWYDYFYHTDHHWNTRAAFTVYGAIARELENLGYPMSVAEALDESNYIQRNYEDVFLGTQGRMTGRYYAGLDDYELWLPEFETDLSMTVPSSGLYREGSFEDAFVFYENLDGYSFDHYAYYAYLNRDEDHIILENRLITDGPRVVIIRDSEAVPVSVFLSLCCSRIDVLDLRYMSGDEDVEGLIRSLQPDIFLYIFGTGYLGNENAMIF